MTIFELELNSSKWKKYSLSFEANKETGQGANFLLDTTTKYSTLTASNFEIILKKMNDQPSITTKITNVCTSLGLGQLVLNSTHVCQQFKYQDKLSLPNSSLETVLSNNLHCSFNIETTELGMGYLFLISNDGEKIEYDIQDNEFIIKSLSLQFAVRPGSDNILGMNALHKKILVVDYYGSTVTLAECTNREMECATHTGAYYGVSFRAFKIALDILIFIFFVSLIFAVVVSYDKFANEDEYVKE